MKNAMLTLILLVLASSLAFPQTAGDEFERGNALYREGKFEQAEEAYASILKQGIASPSIYFNLGNAYYRDGKTAPAILAYERALRLQPNDPDIKHNLDLVNLKTTDRIEPLPELFFIEWLRTLSTFLPLRTTLWLLSLGWLVLFGGLAAMNLLSSSSVLRLLRAVVIFSVIFSIPFAILAATQVADTRSHNDAIVMSSVTTAKTSPDAQSVDAFVVHEGLKVKLSDAVGDWVKIVLPDGKVGWIRSTDCERI